MLKSIFEKCRLFNLLSPTQTSVSFHSLSSLCVDVTISKLNCQRIINECISHSVMSHSATLRTVAISLLSPWNSLGKNTGVGYHSLLQGIFQTQGSNPHLLHYRQTTV